MAKRKKKKPDSDMLLIGVVSLLIALVVFYWKGPTGMLWYGLPAVVGIALLYEAYT